jgi:peptidoglycan/xylan/chitin deacetylase (PgdA/CDA1 family)
MSGFMMQRSARALRRAQLMRRKRLALVAICGALVFIAGLTAVRSLPQEADVVAAVGAQQGTVRQPDAQSQTSAESDAQPQASAQLDAQPQTSALPDGPTPTPAPAAAEISRPLYDDPEIEKKWSSESISEVSGKAKLLPILDYYAKGKDKVAITVDDCFQFDNLREILDLADKYDAKLTFFPIGYQIKKKPEIWREIIDRGHEIQNHSYHHIVITGLTDRQLYLTITMHERALNKVLGVNYKMKYFRPKGGTGRKTPRLSAILRDLGYQAIASWGLSGTQDVDKLIKKCSGGHIILFHTTNKDLKRLRKLLPALKKKGLKMVTINELYNKPPNEITPLPPETA